MPQRNRQHQILIRANTKEHKKLKAKIKKSGLTQNEYILKSALDKNIIQTENLAELRIELKKIGTNINQISKKINQNKSFADDEKSFFISKLEDLREQQEKIILKFNEIIS